MKEQVFKTTSQHGPVAVVGLGWRTDGLHDVHDYWSAAVQRKELAGRGCGVPFLKAFPDEASLCHDPETRRSLSVVEDALDDAGLKAIQDLKFRTTFLLVQGGGQNHARCLTSPENLPHRFPRNPDVSETFAPEAETLDVLLPELPFHAAVEKAFRLLKDAACDVVVVCAAGEKSGAGGNENDFPSGEESEWAPGKGRRSLAEVFAAVVLMRLEDAAARGVGIYALLRAVQTAVPFDEDLPEAEERLEDFEDVDLPILDLLMAGEVSPDTIGLVEYLGPSASGSCPVAPNLFGAFSQAPGRECLKVPLNVQPTRSRGAEIFEEVQPLFRTVLSLSNKILPPCAAGALTIEERPDLPFHVPVAASPWLNNPSLAPRRAVVAAQGRAAAFTLLLEEFTQSPGRTGARRIFHGLDQESELILFSAPTRAELDGQLEHLLKVCRASALPMTLRDVAYTRYLSFDPAHAVRLVLVTRDLSQLVQQLEVWKNRQGSESTASLEREDIYFNPSPRGKTGKVACIFPGLTVPGLSGQYLDRLRDLALRFPEVRAVFDRLDRGAPGDFPPVSHHFFPPEYLSPHERLRLRKLLQVPKVGDEKTEHESVDCFLPSFAVAVSNCAGWELLKRLGLKPNMAFGHSIGEVNALSAAGAVDFVQMVNGYHTMQKQSEVFSTTVSLENRGRLALVHGEDRLVRDILSAANGVTTAIHINPKLRVIGGEREPLLRTVHVLQERGFLAQIIPYPAVHTPCAATLRASWDSILADLKIHSPSFPVYSAGLIGPMPESSEEVRAVIGANLERPIHLWQTLDRLRRDGAKILVHLGSGEAVFKSGSGNEGPEETVSVALDPPSGSAMTQIHRMCALLLTHGVSLDLDALFSHRKVKEIPELIIPAGEAGRSCDTPARDTRTTPGFSAVRDESEENSLARESDGVRMPFMGRVVEYVPGAEIKIQYRLHLERDLYLGDHAFVSVRPFKPLSACMPVLPLAVALEMMSEAAACLAPGFGLTGFEEVRASRWVSIENGDCEDLEISASIVDYDEGLSCCRIKASIFCRSHSSPSMSAVVLMGKQYLLSLNLQFEELTQVRPYPGTAAEIYSERRYFHGPLFHALHGTMTLGQEGILTELKVKSKEGFFKGLADPEFLTDPAVLDGVSQSVSLWALERGMLAFPLGFEKLEFYRPPPGAGTIVPVRAQVAQTGTRILNAEVEVQDGEGAVWMRVRKATFWLYRWSQQVTEFLRFPETTCLSRRIEVTESADAPPCRILSNEELLDFDFEILARWYLHLEEFEEFRALKRFAKRRRDWLLGRVAAKDAVRTWLGDKTGNRELHPAAFAIAREDGGTLRVKHLAAGLPCPSLSISHSNGSALGVAHHDSVGVDLERVVPRERSFLETFTREDEREWIGDLLAQNGDEAMTRLWCAKEAVSKSCGVGLLAAPGRFRLTGIRADGIFDILDQENGCTHRVHTRRTGDWIVALTWEGFRGEMRTETPFRRDGSLGNRA